MAEKKRMTVEEMLASARKADGGGSAPESEPEPPAAEAVPTKQPTAKPAGPAKSASGGRLSVQEMLAMARAEKDGGGAEKKAEPAKAAAKPAAKKAAAASAPAEPRDTASILAAARKSSKAGPMSKAEAAAKEKAKPAAKKAKKPIVVPPMPTRPSYIGPKSGSPAPAKKKKGQATEERRTFLSMGFWSLAGVGTLWSLATLKFLFPNVRREPPSKFKVGFPDSFPAGQVQTKLKAQFGVWVASAEYNGSRQLYALKSVCTHLGCTPSWLEAEQKFKCPCHGSGFYKDGVNFEGPAPRPLERCAIRVADDGQIEIDKSRTFQEEMGQWEDPACFIPV